MPFVLDASIAASWCFPGEEHSNALVAWNHLRQDDEARVPLHWWFEIRNTMITGERRNRITETQITEFLAKLIQLPIIESPRPEDRAVFALARRHRLTFHDAAYLELAKREQLPLATLDDELAAAARAEKVALVSDPR